MPRKQKQSTFPRLETQIHRRKKAKALSPLLPEWETQDGTPPNPPPNGFGTHAFGACSDPARVIGLQGLAPVGPLCACYRDNPPFNIPFSLQLKVLKGQLHERS